jgi:cation diffusion facilitator family transporter
MPESNASVTDPAEQRILLVSTVLTVVFAVGGIVLGLLAGSMAIVFDGLFAFVDVAMALLSLFVARLVTREGGRRFQYGFWHIEPMTLAFNGGLLAMLSVYALVTAVGSLLNGGEEIALGWAMGYAGASAVIGLVMYAYERAMGRRLRSDFVALDRKGWLMTGLAGVALVVAFAVAWGLERTAWAWLAPYVDPAVLVVLSLAFIGLPIGILSQAASEVLLIAPPELDARVRTAMDAVVARHGFKGFTSYVAKVGRGRFVEIHVIVEADRELGPAGQLDAVRREIAEALDARWPDAWLTVDFTAGGDWV